MKTITKFFVALFFSPTLFAQETVYFASNLSEFSNWTFFEVFQGGDGFLFHTADLTPITGLSAQGDAIISYSIDTNTQQAITPANHAMAPVLDLTNYTDVKLTWSRGAGSSTEFAEKYSVFVFIDNDPLDGMIPFSVADIVYSETIAAGQEMLTRTVNIPQVNGKDNVYVIFFHHDCSGQYFLAIDDVIVTGTIATSAVDELGSLKLGVYPVPAKDEVTVECAEKINDLTVLDAQGRNVAVDFNASVNKINTSQLATGIYSIVVRTESGKVVTERFIK